MTVHKTLILAVLAMAALSSGCSVIDHQLAKAATQRSSAGVDRQFEQVLQAPVAPRVVVTDGVWVNKHSVSVKEQQLPAVFHSQLGISFGGRASLKDVANLVSRETGIRFAFAHDVQTEASAPILNAGFTSDEELQALLSRLTAQQNLSWKYVDGSIEIYRFETKVFQIAVLPGTTEFTSQMSNKSGGTTGAGVSAGAINGSTAGTTTGSTGQESKYTMKLDFWKGIKDDIKGLVQTGSYSVSETNHTITVTGTAQVLASVESYVKNLNALKMRQVAIQVHAYAIEDSSSRDFGMSWQAVYTNLAKDIGFTATTPAATAMGLGSLSAVLGPSSSSKWANTQAVINSLSQLGKTSVAAESSQVVLSGESVPISSLRRVGYLAEVSTSNVLNSGTQTSLRQSTETEGFAMMVTPSIINGDYVQINGVLDLSSIDRFNSVSSGGQTIQTPDVSTRSMPIKVGLRSGETYVFGLRQNTANYDDSGVLGASTLLTPAGGMHSSRESRKTIVVTVTAQIINPTLP